MPANIGAGDRGPAHGTRAKRLRTGNSGCKVRLTKVRLTYPGGPVLATFVIGLREGLEAALIVGIIAAFLQRNAKPGAVKQMWVGVVIAILLCLAAGIGLQIISAGLPQRQQEMLECVVAADRRGDGQLHDPVDAQALPRSEDRPGAGGRFGAWPRARRSRWWRWLSWPCSGRAWRPRSSCWPRSSRPGSAVLASLGALLGIAVAVVLGWLIYRGGIGSTCPGSSGSPARYWCWWPPGWWPRRCGPRTRPAG